MRFRTRIIYTLFILLILSAAAFAVPVLAEEGGITVDIRSGEAGASDENSASDENGSSEETGDSEAVKGRTEDPLNLEKNTIASNYFLGDRSLSGMSLQEAQNTVIETMKRFSDTNFVMQSQYREEFRYGAFPEDLGITYDLEGALKSVEKAVQTGSLLERYKKAKDYQLEYGEVETDLTLDEEKIMDYYNYVLPYWNCTPVNAYISYVDGNIGVTRGKVGVQFDFSNGFAKMFEDIRSLDYETSEDGMYYIQIDETPTNPDVTYAKACEFTVLGSYTTSFFAPTTETLANRMQNVMVSAAHMNGSIFAPGEVASALAMYGAVTEENGYKMAGTFNESAHTLELGGGICQTTTTLYNAVLLAELQVNFRNNHSMLVTYVDPSRDAMVHPGSGQDFKFTNSTSDYICIGAWVDQNNYTLTVTIFGHEDQAPDHSVRYETEILEITAPPITLVDDPTKALGWDNVTTKVTLQGTDGPTCGVKSQLWKITTDNGVETRTLFTGPDTYDPSGAVYNCAPDAKAVPLTNGTRESGFVTFDLTFLDGTPLGANPATWTPEEVNAFNRRMYALLQQKGYVWPYGPGIPETVPPEPESEPESEPAPDTPPDWEAPAG